MTKTKTPAPVASDELDVDSLMDTLRGRSREITVGVIVVAAVAGGLLLWRLSALQKGERAEHALYEASDALAVGNRPLAANDLQAVADRYGDTDAGVEGAMLLAQIDFEDQKWDEGLKVLVAIQGSSAIKNFGPAVDGLMGGALADQKKYDDAAKHYLAAAAASPFQPMKDTYSGDAARVLALAGKKDEARKIWEAIVSRPDSPMVGEAKVRLDLIDDQQQRFTIWENFGVDYYGARNDVWLNLKDFHIYFWGPCSKNSRFDPASVRELQLRFYFAKPNDPLVVRLSFMAPK